MCDVRLWTVRDASVAIGLDAGLWEEAAMQENIFMQILWLACGVTTVIAAVLASRSRRARYIGRSAAS